MENDWYCGGELPEIGPGNEKNQKPTLKLDLDNIIVRFDNDVTRECREKIRAKYNVTQFETCSCGNKNFEFWGLDPESILRPENGGVEGLRGERNKAKGERHFRFTIPPADNFKPLDCDFTGDICLSEQDDDKINIAVFDTGIDYRYFKDDSFLFNTAKFGNCPGHTGWAFGNGGSHDVFDRHGHGTYVTKIITDILDEKGIGYRILPLKVLDDNGEGSLWSLLCALSYLEDIQRRGANIHLANLSLGGTILTKDFDTSDFLGELIQKLDKDILFMTSAGNEGIHTDSGLQSHFPSCYTAENILAVGGFHTKKDDDVEVHPQSNYGPLSIDLAVPYDGYKVSKAGLPSVDDLKGTSYGTAHVTALAATLYMEREKESRPWPLDLRALVLKHADISANLRDDKISRNRAIID